MDAADSPPGSLTPDILLSGPGNAHAPFLDQLQAAAMDLETASDTGTHESLTDSTYEIISAANTRSSDDEDSHHDDAESLLSFEDAGPQSPTEVQRDDYVSPEAFRAITPASGYTDDEENPPPQEPSHSPPRVLEHSELTDATMLQTPRASTTLDLSALEAGSSVTEVSHTVDSPTNYFQDGIKIVSSRVSVQQTLSPSKMELGRTFRILWHGDIMVQDLVVEKIAQALAVSTDTTSDSSIMKESSTKFSIVQLSSFGSNQSSPQVTLIPTARTEVVVETCSTCLANHGRNEHKSHCLNLTTTPALEVFFYPTTEKWSINFDDVRPFTKNPYLDIRPATASLQLQPFRPLGGKAVHMHVDDSLDGSLRKASSPWRPITLPIDLDHFQQLDPELLNRNLRCLQDSAIESAQPWHRNIKFRETATSALHRARTAPARKWVINALALLMLFTAVARLNLWLLSSMSGTPPPDVQVSQTLSTVTVTSTSTIQSTVTPSLNYIIRADPTAEAIATPQMTPIVPTSREVGAPLGEAHPTSLTFELLRTGEGQLYLKLPHEMAKLRRPPPINLTAYSGYRFLDTELSKWNASVYSLTIKDFNLSSDPLTIVVDSQKASGVRQVLHYNQRHSYQSIRVLETSLMACLESTKDVARMAQKELGLFRDQANGLIVSSSDWFHDYVRNARASSGRKAGSLWDRLAARREVIRKHADGARQDLMQNANKHAGSISLALSRQISAISKDIQKSVGDFNQVLKQHVDAGLRKAGEAESSWAQARGWKSNNPFTEARRRADILINKARGSMTERREVLKARRLERKQVRATRRHQGKCKKASEKQPRSCW